MFEDSNTIITIILISVAAIIPGWLIRIWLYRIEVRRVIEKMSGQAPQEKK
jgi:hypothetical protein